MIYLKGTQFFDDNGSLYCTLNKTRYPGDALESSDFDFADGKVRVSGEEIPEFLVAQFDALFRQKQSYE